MKIEQIVTGPLQSNCYIVYDEASLDAMVVDPGDEPEKIMRVIDGKGLKVNHIVCTHAHFDHIGAVAGIREKTGAKIVLHRDELEIYKSGKDQGAFWGCNIAQPPEPDLFVSEGDRLSVGRLRFEVLHTPGHSPGGICLYGEGMLLSGDTVFAGAIGRTDLYGGSMEELKKSFKRIISLPPGTEILPGHGDRTTVDEEKEIAPFIQGL